jgi:uncharacterized protein DUF6290
MIRVRISDNDLALLKKFCKGWQVNLSEAIRRLIFEEAARR